MSHRPARSRWAPPAGVAVAILLVSVVPLPGGEVEPPIVPFGIDAWLHAVGYAALGATLSRAGTIGGHRGLNSGVGAVVAAVCFGTGVELLQTVVPTRGFGWSDIWANAIGSAVGGVGWLRSRRRFTRREDSSDP